MIKLCCRNSLGWYVWSYKQRRTKKGHYQWVPHVINAGPFASFVDAREHFPGVTKGSLYSVRLTEDETIEALAEEGTKS